MMCRRRRRQRVENRNFIIHAQNRYIKVDGRVVGKNAGPQAIVVNRPERHPPKAPRNKDRALRQKNNNNAIQQRQQYSPVTQPITHPNIHPIVQPIRLPSNNQPTRLPPNNHCHHPNEAIFYQPPPQNHQHNNIPHQQKPDLIQPPALNKQKSDFS